MFEVGKIYVGVVGFGCGYDHNEYAHYIKVVRVSEHNVWFRTCEILTVTFGERDRDPKDPKSLGYIHMKELTEGEIVRKKLYHSDEFGDYIKTDKFCSVWAKDEIIKEEN